MKKGEEGEQVYPKKSLVFLHLRIMLMEEKKKVRFARVKCLVGMYMRIGLASALVLRRGTHKKGKQRQMKFWALLFRIGRKDRPKVRGYTPMTNVPDI